MIHNKWSTECACLDLTNTSTEDDSQMTFLICMSQINLYRSAMKLNISICNTFYSIGLKLGPLSIILYRLFNKFQNLMIKDIFFEVWKIKK